MRPGVEQSQPPAGRHHTGFGPLLTLLAGGHPAGIPLASDRRLASSAYERSLRPIGSGPPASVRGAPALGSAPPSYVGISAILQAAAAALRSAMNAATQRWFALAGRELARDVRMTRWRELLRVWRVGRVEPRTHGA